VVDREKAQIGALISMQEPTQPMRTEAASAGFYRSPWTGRDYPRLQLRTIAELLDGKGIDYPAIGGGNVTFRKARRAAEDQASSLPCSWCRLLRRSSMRQPARGRGRGRLAVVPNLDAKRPRESVQPPGPQPGPDWRTRGEVHPGLRGRWPTGRMCR
jgi:hypothetical protein